MQKNSWSRSGIAVLFSIALLSGCADPLPIAEDAPVRGEPREQDLPQSKTDQIQASFLATPVSILADEEIAAVPDARLGYSLSNGAMVLFAGDNGLLDRVLLIAPDNSILLEQHVDLADQSTTLRLPSGDMVRLRQSGDKLRLTLELNVTTPATVLVAESDQFGNVRILKDESSLGHELNPQYPAPRAVNRSLASFSRASGRRIPQLNVNCDSVLDFVDDVVSFACNQSSQIAAAGLNYACEGIDQYIEELEEQGTLDAHAAAGLSQALHVTCMALGYAVEGADELGKIGWWGAFCFFWSYADSIYTVFTGTSISDDLCGDCPEGMSPSPAHGGCSCNDGRVDARDLDPDEILADCITCEEAAAELADAYEHYKVTVDLSDEAAAAVAKCIQDCVSGTGGDSTCANLQSGPCAGWHESFKASGERVEDDARDIYRWHDALKAAGCESPFADLVAQAAPRYRLPLEPPQIPTPPPPAPTVPPVPVPVPQ